MKFFSSLIFFFLFFSTGTFSQNRLEKINYIDSTGLKQGPWIDYYTNDLKKIKSIANYLNDNLHGTYYSFFETGQIKSIIEFQYNKKEGKYYIFYENGEIKAFAKYLSGTRIYFAKYKENGTIDYEEILKEGEKQIKHYTKDGIIEGKATIK